MATVTSPILTDATFTTKMDALAAAVKPDASDIPLTPPSGMTATNVQAGISELKQSLSDFEILEKTASGAIATFDDGSDLPMPSLKVSIEPVQSGSGDPSPTNVRPISGWDEVNVTRCGANLCDGIFEQGSIANNGTNQPSTTRCRLVGYMPIKSNETYYCKSDYNTFLFFYDKNKTFIGYYANNVKNNTFKPKDLPNAVSGGDNFLNACYVRFRYDNATFEGNFSINYPSTDTSYHAYNGHIYTIDLGGTRYGGTLNVISGELRITHGSFRVGDANWTRYSTEGQYKFYTTPSNIKGGFNTTINDSRSTSYKLIKFDLLDSNINCFSDTANTLGRISVYDQDYINSTAEEFKVGRADVMFTYELTTPTIIQLTPTQVKSLLGVNNIWADTGNIELTYLTNNPLTQTVYDMVKILVEQST